jgi:polar amino acid transport system substrate-binding protein
MPSFAHNLRVCVLLLFAFAMSGPPAAVAQAQQSTAEQPAGDTAAAAGNDDTDTGEQVVMQVDLPERSGDLLDTIRQRGVLLAGMSTFTPWAMHNKDGDLIGFEVDVAKQLAEDLGVELQLVETSWTNIISDLLDGRYDIIVSGLSITPARALLVEYSDAYHYSEILLLANKAKAGGLSSKEDFNKAGMIIGVRPETTGYTVAARLFPEAELKPFDDEAAMYEALSNGDVQAVVGSSPRPTIEAMHAPDQVYLPMTNSAGREETLAKTMEGFAVRKGNQSLLNFLNAWISYHSTSQFLYDKDAYWFRSLQWEDQL